jgi:phosphocarrier protein
MGEKRAPLHTLARRRDVAVAERGGRHHRDSYRRLQRWGGPVQQRGRGQMPSQTVTVGSRVGLHARPAALIAEAVGRAGVRVTMSTPGGAPVDAGSPLMIMTLGAKQGTEVVVSADDEAVLDQIADMVAQNLDG